MTRGQIPIELGHSWLTAKTMAVVLSFIHSMEYSTGFILTSESSLADVELISQGIEAKLDGQERNNSISRLKFPNGG